MGVEKEAAKAASKSFGEFFGDILQSNKPIIDAFDGATGINTFVKDLVGKEGSHAFKTAGEKAGYYALDEAGKLAKLNYGKIAGAYIGVSAGARIASGGGLYKDRNGNTNLMGLPII